MAHVLLLEPNTLLAAAYTQALQHAGHKVTHRSSGQAAVEAADAASPDIVVLELQLTAHNGIEFLHEFRSYPDWQKVPVVINTLLPPSRIALAEEALRRDLGVGAILYKPRASLQDLLRVIREQLDEPA
jgi:DNA-binding response OmpR family regulator